MKKEIDEFSIFISLAVLRRLASELEDYEQMLACKKVISILEEK